MTGLQQESRFRPKQLVNIKDQNLVLNALFQRTQADIIAVQ